MADTLLTADMITREALRIAHQSGNFIRNITRSYDGSFAKTGAKIGDTLRIRLPNQFTVSSGLDITANIQDITEASTTLAVQTVKNVAWDFTMQELTMKLDDYSDRILKPAVARLVADVESDAISMYKDVFTIQDDDTVALSYLDIAKARRFLNENLAPDDDNRCAILSPFHTVKALDAEKGLFNAQEAIAKQFKKGQIAHQNGFDFYENTLLTDHQTGTAAKVTAYLSNGATQTGASITVDTGVTTFKKGDVITFAGTNAVHPETKASYGYLKMFVITADYAGGAGNLAISPSVVAAGATQNVSQSIADNSAITKVAAGASELINTSLLFHPEAFVFATADLMQPMSAELASRKVLDGISLSFVVDYDILKHRNIARLDILYGFKTVRGEWAVRLHADG